MYISLIQNSEAYVQKQHGAFWLLILVSMNILDLILTLHEDNFVINTIFVICLG